MTKTAQKDDTQSKNEKALYIKYRPQKFNDVLGQEHITNLLQDTLKLGNIAHAYLFSGSRGTGKTSVARILAREIGTTEKDLYEIDAASNNSVDDIRELNESVNILPFDSKYKVYILDEVHMLSKSAFNALLKTLEEPPKHVIFILATTEPEKILDTIISRCETYNFKTPNREVLKKISIATAKKEGYELEPAAAELIAILGDGSFRDTHTNLQKLIRSSADKKLTVEEVERVTEAPNSKLINDFVEALLLGDLPDGLSVIKTAQESNLDIKFFMKILLEKVRIALLMKISPNDQASYVDLITEEDSKVLSGIIEKGGDKLNSKLLAGLLNVYEQSVKSYLPFLPLELFLIENSQQR
jgi:DNA polymerase-3 subunit gamma/tau